MPDFYRAEQPTLPTLGYNRTPRKKRLRKPRVSLMLNLKPAAQVLCKRTKPCLPKLDYTRTLEHYPNVREST